MHKILIICLLTLPLFGCPLVAFLVGGATAGAVITEPRSWTTIKDDETIDYQINRKLANHSNMATQAHITGLSYNRVVLLTGQAPNETLRQQATQYAQTTPHVKRVFNEITLGTPTTTIRRAKDVAITSAVRTRMLAKPGLGSNQFKIITENGTVFILGLANRQQANLAASVVQGSPGVKKVVKLIEYTRK